MAVEGDNVVRDDVPGGAGHPDPILDVAEISGARLRADEVALDGVCVRGGDLDCLLAVARDELARSGRRPADGVADEVALDHVVGVDSKVEKADCLATVSGDVLFEAVDHQPADGGRACFDVKTVRASRSAGPAYR